MKKKFIKILVIGLLLFYFVGIVIADSGCTIWTPNYTAVTATFRDYELTAGEIFSNDLRVMNSYQNVTILRSSSRRYNCHSYAWHSQDCSNTIWLDPPQQKKYWMDGSYYNVSMSSSNDRVDYVYGDHSAIVYSGATFISKWGSLGLIRHNYANCPYSAITLSFYRR